MIRKHLSAPGLYGLVKNAFLAIPDHRAQGNVFYSLTDTLSSGLAVFAFKAPSLLNFMERTREPLEGANIKALFQIPQVPSDTQLRDILDPVQPEQLRPAYDSVLREFQRGNELQKFMVLGYYAIALDGTGVFSSSNIHCPHCLVKKSKSKTNDKSQHDENEEEECIYHHQMLGACIVHPLHRQVIPLFPEPITNQDGFTKNDCERNASKRWIQEFRRHHPKMPTLILEDSLASNLPHLKTLRDHDCRYLTGVKESDHKYLFEQFRINSNTSCTFKHQEAFITGEKVRQQVTRSYEFISGLELNRSDSDFKTNLIIFKERREFLDPRLGNKKATIKEINFSWVTDLEVTEENVSQIVTLARRRWAIENETFQTLKKTTDYNLEHNYGHGKEYLATNFALLCMLAFLIDQVQEFSCEVFKEILAKAKSKSGLWQTMRSSIEWVQFSSWEHLMTVLLERCRLSTA
jgi:hypothetical protein